MHLSVIVPAYNEEKNLEKNIYKFNEYLSRQNYDYEIIIVNDGSKDNTEIIAKNVISNIVNSKLVNNEINLGKGGAIRKGFQAAMGEYLLFIDADNATTIDHLDKVWEHFEKGYDLVIGSRNARDITGAYQKIKQPLWKRSFGIGGNLLIQALSVPGIWDTQCGFKIFSSKTIEIISPKQTIDRWAFDVEMLVLAQKNNFKIAKIPVVWVNSANSRVGIKGYFTSLKEIFKISWNKVSGKYN